MILRRFVSPYRRWQARRMVTNMIKTGRIRVLSRIAPRSYVRDTFFAEEAQDALQLKVILDKKKVRVDAPHLREYLQTQAAVSHQDYSFESERVFTCVLKNALFDARTGMVCTDDGKLLVDSAKNTGRVWRSATYGSPIRGALRLEGTYSSIHSTHINNYFHWMIETLPRIYSLAKTDEQIKLLMPNDLKVWQKESLQYCLPDNVELHFVSKENPWYQVDRYIFPSYLTTIWDFAYPPSEHLNFIRTQLFKSLELPLDHQPKRRIYISRAKAGIRYISNEDQIVNYLSQHGFETLYTEELSFKEQVALFHEAECVVASTGAALTNILYAPPTLKVVELSSMAVSPVFFFLSMALGQDYNYVWPDGFEQRDKSITHHHGHPYSIMRDQDFSVSVARLAQVIENK